MGSAGYDSSWAPGSCAREKLGRRVLLERLREPTQHHIGPRRYHTFKTYDASLRVRRGELASVTSTPTSLIAANKRDYLNVPDTCLYRRHLSFSSSTFLEKRYNHRPASCYDYCTGPWGLPSC